MRLIAGLIAAILVPQQGASPPGPSLWGNPVDGLRLAVELLSEGGSSGRLRVTVRSVGNRQLLLPAAVVNNARFLNWPVTVVVSTPRGERRFGRWPYAGAIAGHLDPVTVPMLPDSTYAFEIPVRGWYKEPGQAEELQDLIRQPGRLWIEWEVEPAKGPVPNCPLYGMPGTAEITCWQNKMVSNSLQLPR
jgi:hypothetical protein